MKVSCQIIEDLLPLYSEKMVSPDSWALVDEHLETCPACQKLYHQMIQSMSELPPNDPLPLKGIRSRLHREKSTILWLSGLVVALLALSFFSWLSLPQYLPYYDDMIKLHQTGSGEIYATLDPSLSSFSTWQTSDPDLGTTGLVLEAWTSRWDNYLGRTAQPHTILLSSPEKPYDFFEYVNNSGDDHAPIITLSPRGNYPKRGQLVLPRLALNYYLFIAAMMGGLGLVLWFLLRKKAYAWIPRSLFFLGLSYSIGHFIIKGFSGPSYHLLRDFSFISLAGLMAFGVLSFSYRYLQLKNEL